VNHAVEDPPQWDQWVPCREGRILGGGVKSEHAEDLEIRRGRQFNAGIEPLIRANRR